MSRQRKEEKHRVDLLGRGGMRERIERAIGKFREKGTGHGERL